MNVRWRDAEPYRLLFPLGTLLALAGVSLWPLFLYKIIPFYPGAPHARTMIEGFSACFILGFLSTALPHMLAAPRFTLAEIVLWCLGLLSASALHLAMRPIAGDLTFAGTLILFLGCVAVRIPRSNDRPPPGLPTVFLGVLCALAGSLLQVIDLYTALPAFVQPFSRLLLNQAFLLLPVMGVGAFILPVFVGYPRRQSPHLLAARPHGWLRETAYMAMLGLIVIATIAIEAVGYVRIGNLLRGLLLLFFLARHLPVHRRQENPGTIAWLTRLALMALPIGFLLIPIWSNIKLSWLHILYINGLALLILSVASRVIVAHGGFQRLFRAQWSVLWWIFALITLAMLTRVAADWIPTRQYTHYAYAAITWIAGLLIWFGVMIKFLLTAESPQPDAAP
ncbi:MAG: NnrS family protein [Kiritimatiellae bacterium]|nr:NnrS family protein [Kiritimatiellia bacterium]